MKPEKTKTILGTASENPITGRLVVTLFSEMCHYAALATAVAALLLLSVAVIAVDTASAVWPVPALAGAVTLAGAAWLWRRRPRQLGAIAARDTAPNPGISAATEALPPPLADSGSAEPRLVTTATATSFDFRQTVRLALQGADPFDTNRLSYRVDANLPERVFGGEDSLSGLLRALASVSRGEPACCIQLHAAAAPPGRIGVELEMRRKTAAESRMSPPAFAAAEALIHDLGGHLDYHPEPGTLLVDGRFELGAADSGPTHSPVHYPGRALFVLPDPAWDALNARIALPGEGRCVAVSTFDAAAREFALSIRRGKPYSTILASCELVFQPQALAPARDFSHKCAVADVPFYLLGEPRPNRDFLHELGYAGWLADIDGPTLRRAMLTAPATVVGRSDRVVPVAPWLWGRRRTRRRVLVVDDMRTTRLIVSDILKASGYEVESVDNAETALQFLQRGNLSLAILDLHMPGTDGITLLQRYHQSEPAEPVPILILTANTTKVATQECAAAGADAYLTKPIHSENLLGIVRTLIAEDDLRRYGERHIPTTVPPESLPLIERDAFRGIAHFVPAAEIIRQFQTETSDILARFEQALQDRRHDACIDLARSLRTCALAVGASALAGAAERLETLSAESLDRSGTTAATDLHRLLESTIEAMAREAN